jgi:hypothetical protein
MKSKEELLKIYSAYLPYELEVTLSDEGRYNLDSEYPNEHAYKKGMITEFSFSNGDFGYGEFQVSKNYYFSINELSEIKPVLYPMDMLTKEIEHKGERFIPIVKLFNVPDTIELLAIGYEKKHYYSKFGFDAEIITYKIHSDVGSMDYFTVQKLLEWHFNVFGLDESEYIKKESLNRSEIPNS